MKTLRELVDSFIWNHMQYLTSPVEEGGEDAEMLGVRVLDEPS